MPIRCDWLVLCERVIEDTQSGGLTLVNCLDQVQAWSVPSTLPGFGFAARFSRDGEDPSDAGPYEFRFVRIGGSGAVEPVVETEGRIEDATQTLRVFFNFAMLRLFREEVIRFRIDWRRPAQRWHRGPMVPLRVVLAPPEDRARIAEDLAHLQAQMEREEAT